MKTVLASELADALVDQPFALLSTLSGGLKWVKTMSELADAPVVGLNQPSASLKSTINTFRLVEEPDRTSTISTIRIRIRYQNLEQLSVEREQLKTGCCETKMAVGFQ